jgi:hypothetical protein
LLAYLFWHRPRQEVAADSYEQDQLAFHRSLCRKPPFGFLGSALFRLPDVPWLAPSGRGNGYEDWYLLEDFAALGVLNEAAVGRGHGSVHARAARRVGEGAGGLYGLHEGNRAQLVEDSLGPALVAVWVGRAPGSAELALGSLLADGADPQRASLWRRRLVLGPAPEFCLLADHVPAGAASSRLPQGWSAQTVSRESLWQG